MNFDKYLFHASAFSKLMTDPKSKEDKEAGKISATTLGFLKEIFIEARFNRVKDITTKYTEKGLLQEENAITLYCRLKKGFLKKNETRLENDYITGEPDLVDHKDIMKTHRGVDVKCPWSVYSLPWPDEKLDKAYWWQNQCYMFLSGAKEWATAFCLVNAPGHMILDEKKKLYYKLNCPADNDPLYIAKCIEIEKQMIFDMEEFMADEPNFDLDCKDWTFDIPMKDRMIEFETKRDDFSIDLIPTKVNAARKQLNDWANLVDGNIII